MENQKEEVEKKQEKTAASGKEILKGLRTGYIPGFFVTMFIVVVLVYWAFSIWGVSLNGFWGNVLAFLTSPFNLGEIYSKVYNSYLEGYFFNGVFTAGIIFVAIIYPQLLATNRRVKPELVFWTSIIASYLVSMIVWFFTGAPSTGTSIVGFCMVGFLLVSSMNDLRDYFSKKIRHPSKLSIIEVTTITAIAIFSLIFAILFYSLGENAYVHFVGGAICAFLIFVMIKLR